MGMNLPAPRVPEPPSVQRAAGDVLDRLGQAIRRAQVVGAAHGVLGCPRPGSCAPCRAEARRQLAVEIEEYRARDEVARREAVRQHVVSAARLAGLASAKYPISRPTRHSSPAALRAAQRRQARDAALIQRTAQQYPGARCRVCSTLADGRVCRSCDPSALTARDRRPGSPRSVSGARDLAQVPPGDLEGTYASPRPGLSRPSPGTDPIGFARALRDLAHAEEANACLG